MRDRQVATYLRQWSGFSRGMISSSKPNVPTTLSDVLESSQVPEKYYLSPKACRGILRRAEKRGRALPPSLQTALERVALTTIKRKPGT